MRVPLTAIGLLLSIAAGHSAIPLSQQRECCERGESAEQGKQTKTYESLYDRGPAIPEHADGLILTDSSGVR